MLTAANALVADHLPPEARSWGGLGRVAGPVVGSLLYTVSPRLPFRLLGLAAIVIRGTVVARTKAPPASPRSGERLR